MKKHLYTVEYNGGESRERAGEACDYMLVWVPNPECEFDEFADEEIGLYAEAPAAEEDETATYEELRAEIIRQAVAAGIEPATLKFWYD